MGSVSNQACLQNDKAVSRVRSILFLVQLHTHRYRSALHLPSCQGSSCKQTHHMLLNPAGPNKAQHLLWKRWTGRVGERRTRYAKKKTRQKSSLSAWEHVGMETLPKHTRYESNCSKSLVDWRFARKRFRGFNTYSNHMTAFFSRLLGFATLWLFISLTL